jgi:hypothetical protein
MLSASDRTLKKGDCFVSNEMSAMAIKKESKGYAMTKNQRSE